MIAIFHNYYPNIYIPCPCQPNVRLNCANCCTNIVLPNRHLPLPMEAPAAAMEIPLRLTTQKKLSPKGLFTLTCPTRPIAAQPLLHEFAGSL